MAGSPPNQARDAFLDPAARDFHPQWEAVVAEPVAQLRRDAGPHPDDPALAALVGELSLCSEEFRRLWADHLVREKTSGVKLLRHPLVGGLEFGYEILTVNGVPDQMLVVYTAPPDSPTAQKPALLASWTAPDAAPATSPGPAGAGTAAPGAAEPGTPPTPGGVLKRRPGPGRHSLRP
ncbi:MmyB family transcriptional regulator [Kitasatospora cathayae]|uniref:MmyB-like transcription regulator ligand binding domain-containing protein n=1 Tax=Kitasatospora cathayae TaxID=3004092 RepID=A0ABY7Q671_9ACTN|nr:hypothetical protein [Kitasatospora sp. HUAS 3-15]WBP88107.1 hypothetical protein O1G21_21255 [Kitasatospora sp. HUAS 3-15]